MVFANHRTALYFIACVAERVINFHLKTNLSFLTKIAFFVFYPAFSFLGLIPTKCPSDTDFH